MEWVIKCRLQNGVEKCYPISTSDKERLWNGLPNICEGKGVNFFEFDTDTHRIFMQSSQLMFIQFLFEPYGASSEEPDQDITGSYPVKFYFVNDPNPLILHFYADEPADPQDEGDEGEMQNFLYYMLLAHEESEVIPVTDMDGETAFFQPSSLALIETPLKIFEPVDFSSFDEDDPSPVDSAIADGS
jgi:hypothetical protein